MTLTTKLVLTAITGAAVLGGCSTHYDPSRTDFAYLTDNLTPEVQGINERPVDVDRGVAYTVNTNLREMSDDWGRAFLFDHPTRLSPYPIMTPSGVPR